MPNTTNEPRHTEVIPLKDRENFCRTTKGSGRYTTDWITAMTVDRDTFVHTEQEKLLLKKVKH